MSIDTQTLIWLFPIAFILHDFEEIIFWEGWLAKNGEEVKHRVPDILSKPVSRIVGKSTAEAAVSIVLIFSLTVVASFVAAVYGKYGFFLLASGAFFMHGFMHLGQAVALRRYVPAVISSALVVLPYGGAVFGRLKREGIVTLPGVLAGGTTLPVIGIPLATSELKGMDALYSIVQMPGGIPVACMAVGSWGVKNAAYLAAEILGLKYNNIRESYDKYRSDLARS